MNDACFQMVCNCNGCTKNRKRKKKDTHFETFIKNMFTNYMSSVFKKTTRECSHPQPPPPKNIVTDLNL